MQRVFQSLGDIVRNEQLQARLAFAVVWTFLAAVAVWGPIFNR